MDRKGLAAYIHTGSGRAYLTLSCDIHGRWNAAYIQHYAPDRHGRQRSEAYGPRIEDAESPDQAMESLFSVLQQESPWK